MYQDAPVKDLADLARIEQPSLVLANHDDPLHPFDFATVIDFYLPNSEIHEVVSRYVDDEKHGNQVRTLVSSFLRKKSLK
jgi:pimeloyl-ACP methyl ester carboxylesterase